MPILEINNINCFYGNIQVLWDVTLNVEEAEIVALLGANAAGKTTLLNTITGIIKPVSGTINFLGKRVDGLPCRDIVEMGMAYLPEGGRLFPEMTVQENLEMGAFPKQLWKQKGETMDFIYGMFPRLKEKKGQLARTLSGGERQMLAMGRSLMSKPKLCLFDELSYGLAPKLVREAFKTVESLRDRGITVFLVEQNVKQTMEIADRAYVLENGRLVLDGKCESLVENDYIKKAYLGI